MNYGRFFSLNKEKSNIVDGILFFDYRRIKVESYKTGSARFPIYVYISPNYVTFELHVHKGVEDEGEHAHFSLFKIPLDENAIKDTNFTDMLRGAYFASFRYDVEDDWFKFLYDNKSGGKKSYSTLQAFDDNRGVSERNDDDKLNDNNPIDNKLEEGDWKEGNKPSFRLLRELLLDFLFDLDQKESVFNISPYSIALLSKICRNPLFNAIVKKARYYYYQKEFYTYNKNKAKEVSLLLLVQKAKDWNNLIKTEESEFLFHNSGWCRDVEPEMIEMFSENRCSSKNFSQDFYKKEWDEMWNMSQNWLLKRFSFKNSIIFFFTPVENNFIVKKINSFSQRRKYVEKFRSPLISLQKALFNKGIPLLLFIIFVLMISDHFLYTVLILLILIFSGVFKSSKRGAVINLMLPRLWATIVSTWIVLMCNTEILKNFCDLEMDGKVLSLQFVIIVLILFFFRAETKKANPFLPRGNRIVSSCWIITLGLIYSLITGVALSSFASDKILINSSFLKDFLHKNITERPIFEMNDCYSYLAKTFYYDCVGVKDKDSYRRRCEHIINRDSLLIDHIVKENKFNTQELDFGYLNEKWNCLLSNEKNRYRLMCVICLDIINEKDNFLNYRPGYNYKDADFHSLFLFKKLMKTNLTSYSYFDSLKYFTFKNGCFNRQLFVEIEFCGFYIRYFPVFLALFSCISMFIGVFLQTIIENKKITEAI